MSDAVWLRERMGALVQEYAGDKVADVTAAALREIARLRAEKDAVTQSAVRLLSSCDKHETETMPFDAFLAAGGGDCPLCQKAELTRLRAANKALVEAATKARDRLVCTLGRGETDPNVICYCPNCDRKLNDVFVALSRAVEGAKHE